MHRFFISPADLRGEWAQLDASQSHHIDKVLRLKAGDQVRVFDGEGREFIAVLGPSHGECVEVKILYQAENYGETRLRLSLIQALPKGEKMDFIIQKAVEIGVADIYPVLSERSVVRLDGERAVKKVGRWQTVAREACKQCRRSCIPLIHPIQNLSGVLQQIDFHTIIMLYEGNSSFSLKQVLKRETTAQPTQMAIIIGPEGGFAPHEVEKARQTGAVTVGLGPRILRTETAGLVAASIIFYEYDELG